MVQRTRPGSRRFRRRLTAIFVLVAGVSAGLVASVTFVLAREYRWRNLRATAVEETRFALAVAPLGLDPGSFERFVSVYERRSDAHILAIGDGRTLSSSDLGASDIPFELTNPGREPSFVEADLNGRPVLVSGAVGADGVRYYLFFPLEQLQDSLDELARAALLSWLGTTLVAGAVGWLIARRTLRPIATTAGVAEAIAGGDLSARLPVTASDEFGLLAQSFNNMADEVQRLIGQLEETAERERRFTADVAHELRTPLTGMSASASLLAEHLGDIPALSRRPAEILVHDVDRLRLLVTELLELAQLDAGGAPPTLYDLDLNAAISAVITDADGRRRADLTVDIAPGLTVAADPNGFRRVMGNLIDNAIKHGGGTVLVIGRREDGRIRVDVVDDGPGIATAELDHIFERFHKSDRSRSGGGSGLGLAIAREHARRQGGELFATNDAARGARFTVVFADHAAPEIAPSSEARGEHPRTTPWRQGTSAPPDASAGSHRVGTAPSPPT